MRSKISFLVCNKQDLINKQLIYCEHGTTDKRMRWKNHPNLVYQLQLNAHYTPAECTVANCKAFWIWRPRCSVASSCQRSICYLAPLPPGDCSKCWFWKISDSNSINSEPTDLKKATCSCKSSKITGTHCSLIGTWLTLWQGFRFPNTLQLPACRAWERSYSRLHLTCPHSHPPHYTAEFWEYSDLKERK